MGYLKGLCYKYGHALIIIAPSSSWPADTNMTVFIDNTFETEPHRCGKALDARALAARKIARR
jgi:hypothetical protein